MDTGFSAADSRDDFARARRNAILTRMAARLRMRDGDIDVLLPFDEVVGALGHHVAVLRALGRELVSARVTLVRTAMGAGAGLRLARGASATRATSH